MAVVVKTQCITYQLTVDVSVPDEDEIINEPFDTLDVYRLPSVPPVVFLDSIILSPVLQSAEDTVTVPPTRVAVPLSAKPLNVLLARESE